MKKRVMIVDDSPVMRSFVKRALAAAGLGVETCVEAGDGREALLRLAVQRVDVILTDINMPVMDGESLLRALRGDGMTQSIPVVVVSTDSTEHRMKALLELGAAGYVRKPFAPERLCEVLGRVLPDWLEQT
jgi:two-component system chemotaxis response regulator CheY